MDGKHFDSNWNYCSFSGSKIETHELPLQNCHSLKWPNLLTNFMQIMKGGLADLKCTIGTVGLIFSCKQKRRESQVWWLWWIVNTPVELSAWKKIYANSKGHPYTKMLTHSAKFRWHFFFYPWHKCLSLWSLNVRGFIKRTMAFFSDKIRQSFGASLKWASKYLFDTGHHDNTWHCAVQKHRPRGHLCHPAEQKSNFH